MVGMGARWLSGAEGFLGAWSPGALEGARRFDLVYMRESGPHAEDLLASLVDRTVYAQGGLRDAAAIAAASIRPVVEASFPGAIQVPLPQGRAALCIFDSTIALYVLSSAAAGDLGGEGTRPGREENAATALFCEVLQQVDPQNVYILKSDRLLRSPRFTEQVLVALRASERTLHMDGKSYDVRSMTFRTDLETQAADASKQLQTSMRQLTGGIASLVRKGRWPWAPHGAPFGYRVDRDGRLVIDDDEQAFAVAALPELQSGAVWSRVAAKLVDKGLVPRRRWAQGEYVRNSELVPSGCTESQMVEQRLKIYANLLPDLAQGVYVRKMRQAKSFDVVHAGARLERTSGGGAQHHYVFDVPDLFEEVPEEVLRPAVEFTMQRRVQRRLPASAWVLEQREREALLERVAQGETLSVDERGWAGDKGEMVQLMGGNTLRPWVRSMSDRLESDGAAVRAPARSRREKLLTGLEPWTKLGVEMKLVARWGSYVLMVREPDPALSPRSSLRRAWSPRYGRAAEDVARIGLLDLHRAIVTAAIDALDGEGPGVPQLRSTDLAAHLLTIDEAGEHIAHDAARGRLEKAVVHARQSQEAAATYARSLFRASIVDAETLGEVPSANATGRDLLIAEARSEVEQASEGLAQALAALNAFRSRPSPEPETVSVASSAVETVADALAVLHERTHATGEQRARIHRLIRELRITDVRPWDVTGTITLAIHSPGQGVRVVGPVEFTAPRREPVDPKERARGRAAAACTDDATAVAHSMVSHIRERESSHDEGPKAAVPARRAGHAFSKNDTKAMAAALIAEGMDKFAAGELVRHPLAVVRAAVYELVFDTPPDGQTGRLTALDSGFVVRLRHDFLDTTGPVCNARTGSHLLQAAVDSVIASGGEMPYDAVEKALGRPDDKRRYLLSRLTKPSSGRRLYEPPLRTETAVLSRTIIPVLRLRACPHCHDSQGGHLDIVFRSREVPSGLICSTCMRASDQDSPVYPNAYRDLRQVTRNVGADQGSATTQTDGEQEATTTDSESREGSSSASTTSLARRWTNVALDNPIDATGCSTRGEAIVRHLCLQGRDDLPGLRLPKNDGAHKALINPAMTFLEANRLSHATAAIMLDHPLKEAPRTLWEQVLDPSRPLPFLPSQTVNPKEGTAPDGLDTFAARVVRGYTEEGPDMPPFNPPFDRLQPALNVLNSLNAPVTVKMLKSALGVHTAAGTAIIEALAHPADGRRPLIRVEERTGKNLVGSLTLTVAPCPHCTEPLDIIAHIPEVPEGAMCSTCLRAPSPNSPVYPVEYRKLRKAPSIIPGAIGPRARDRQA